MPPPQFPVIRRNINLSRRLPHRRALCAAQLEAPRRCSIAEMSLEVARHSAEHSPPHDTAAQPRRRPAEGLKFFSSATGTRSPTGPRMTTIAAPASAAPSRRICSDRGDRLAATPSPRSISSATRPRRRPPRSSSALCRFGMRRLSPAYEAMGDRHDTSRGVVEGMRPYQRNHRLPAKAGI